jgi:predicted Zn-dependent protease
MNTMRHFGLLLALALTSAASHPEPLIPQHDAELLETLPAVSGGRAEERRLRRERAADPTDPVKAAALARRYIERARALGDPRPAGQALAVLQAWPDPSRAPDDVLLMRATIEQYLHHFDTAAGHLERLVQRRPQHAQAWLTLATVRRVQGRYAESDAACAGLTTAGALWHAAACRAENDALRGDFDVARAALHRLLGLPGFGAPARGWLLTTLAELETRTARPAAAEAAYREAQAAHADGYTTLSYADFLLQQGRYADALSQLKDQPRSDAVLLRLAIAGVRIGAAEAQRDAREMRERMRLADLRPDAQIAHAREKAMFALWVDVQPQRALQWARANVRRQREPLDLLVFAHAARVAGDEAAMREAQTISKEMGLHDRRFDALL